MDLIKVAEQAFAGEKKEFPAFKAGDQITVGYRIKEGNKERVQEFRGDVICIHGSGDKKRFTVRKMSGNVGVERIFPMDSPFIESITVNKYGKEKANENSSNHRRVIGYRESDSGAVCRTRMAGI